MMPTLKILVADEHPIVGDGLRANCPDRNWIWLPQVSNLEQLHSSLQTNEVRVVVAETRLGHQCLLNAWQLWEIPPERTCLLIFSRSDDLPDFVRAATTGAFDYVVKTEPIDQLYQALAAIAADKPTDPRGVLKLKLSRLRKPREPVRDDVPLTSRELQVLKLVALGLSNREIARALKVGVETVKEHIQNILRKLNLNDRTHAAVWAVRKDLI